MSPRVVLPPDLLTTAVGDLNTLTGVAQNAEDLGTFSGSTIADSVTVKTALQTLETTVEDILCC